MRTARIPHPRPTPVATTDTLLESECEAQTSLPPTHILVDIPDWAWQDYMVQRWEDEQESWR